MEWGLFVDQHGKTAVHCVYMCNVFICAMYLYVRCVYMCNVFICAMCLYVQCIHMCDVFICAMCLYVWQDVVMRVIWMVYTVHSDGIHARCCTACLHCCARHIYVYVWYDLVMVFICVCVIWLSHACDMPRMCEACWWKGNTFLCLQQRYRQIVCNTV